ncbi:hypothetical protein Tco_0869476, partial [Tanacetum coccineum]
EGEQRAKRVDVNYDCVYLCFYAAGNLRGGGEGIRVEWAVRRQTTIVVVVGRRYSHHSLTMWCRAMAAQPLGVPCCAQPLDATTVAAAEPALATTTTTAAPCLMGWNADIEGRGLGGTLHI